MSIKTERFPLGNPVLEVLEGTPKYPFRLTKDFVYLFPGDEDFPAQTFIAFEGFESDMFSIPSYLKGIINPIGAGMHGAIIHDVLCSTEYGLPFESIGRRVLRANRVLRQCMLDSGSGAFRAWLVYRGVQIGCRATWDAHEPEEVTDDLIEMQQALERWERANYSVNTALLQ
jgi:hypothetical protein